MLLFDNCYVKLNNYCLSLPTSLSGSHLCTLPTDLRLPLSHIVSYF